MKYPKEYFDGHKMDNIDAKEDCGLYGYSRPTATQAFPFMTRSWMGTSVSLHVKIRIKCECLWMVKEPILKVTNAMCIEICDKWVSWKSVKYSGISVQNPCFKSCKTKVC